MPGPQTAVGRNRARILQAFRPPTSPVSVAALVAATGCCSRTVLTHLTALVALGLVDRTNYRRWQLAPGINPSRLDGTRLDPQGEPNASDR